MELFSTEKESSITIFLGCFGNFEEFSFYASKTTNVKPKM